MIEEQPVLSFKHKDSLLITNCVEKGKNRTEVFLDLATDKEEIERYLSSCRITPSHRFSSDLVEPTDSFTLNDNLLIKGDNLLALHQLLKTHESEVKCMYWDILYNTQNNSISYNDSFKHSSWLTMMKNRLEIAKELLSEDGSIFIHLDDTEMAYLKVLCDEIFGRENYITTITCKVKAPSGVASGAQPFFNVSEYVLYYAKNKKKFSHNSIKVKTEVVNEGSKTAKNAKYLLKSIDLNQKQKIGEIDGVSIFKVPTEFVEIETINWKKVDDSFCFQNNEKIFRLAALSGGTEKKISCFLDELDDNTGVYLYGYRPQRGKDKGRYVEKLVYKKQAVLFLKDHSLMDEDNQVVFKTEHISNLFISDLWQGISSEGSVVLKNGKKPESFIKTLLEVGTNPNDLVLDAYLGSGTTAAVAHKMGRRYIGIEQLDNHFLMSQERLLNVVNGDKSGISKTVDWQGGGSFVNCELETTYEND